MFGLRRLLHRRTIDKQAAQQLRGLGYSQAQADYVISKVRGLYRKAQHTDASDAVRATPAFYAAGLDWSGTRRSLHATAVLAYATGGDYECIAQILTRMACLGRVTVQDFTCLMPWGIPLWLLKDEPDGTHIAFRERVKRGEVTYEETINAILRKSRSLEV